jgi:hypothetical protein
MTPKCKTSCSTTLAIERRAVLHEAGTDKTKVHVAGGDHRGIVINKEVTQGMNHKAHKQICHMSRLFRMQIYQPLGVNQVAADRSSFNSMIGIVMFFFLSFNFLTPLPPTEFVFHTAP